MLIDDEDRIIAGHGRVAAAKLLGIATVPTIRLEHLTEAQKRAYVIADNRLAELAGWDKELLALELRYLSELEIDFDLTLTGFEIAEIDLLLETDAAEVAEPTTGCRSSAVRRSPGWAISGCSAAHRLLCGDATDAAAYRRLMAGKRAQLVFTDPPYNVPIDGHVCGLGADPPSRVRHGRRARCRRPSSPPSCARLRQPGRITACDGSIHFVCMDWRHSGELLEAGRQRLRRAEEPVRLGQGQRRHGRASTARSTSWSSSSRTAPRPTSTTSSSASTAATGPTSGTTPASTPCRPGGWRSCACIRR